MRDVGDLEALAQFGSRKGGFRNHPRATESDVSVLVGRLTVEEATVFVRGRPPDPGDGVRYARAGALRKAGFSVTHTPSRSIPVHASVEFPGVWDHGVESRFDRSFSEPMFYG